MRVVAWYAAVAGVLFPVGALLLHRMAWPTDLKTRFAAAAALALAWPLAVPMLSFGSVAIARLLQERPPSRRKRDAARVAPAA